MEVRPVTERGGTLRMHKLHGDGSCTLRAAATQGERTCPAEAPAIEREEEHACCKTLYLKKATVHVLDICCVLVWERKENMFIESLGMFILF